MASVSQTIQTYNLGISKQPDERMLPGQLKNIVNATPDVTDGLPKRLGSKRIGLNPLTNVQGGGTFFSYFRDENEGSYIGQVSANGRVRVWSCVDGVEKNVWYDQDNEAYSASNAAHKSITNYLKASNPEDIQTLTINDTTFLANRDRVVTTDLGSYNVDGNYNDTSTSSTQCEELFLQYTTAADPTSGATWVDVGKIIPINNSRPSGKNDYYLDIPSGLSSVAFRLYQPTNTSDNVGSSMDAYGITTLKYKKSDGSVYSTLTMSDTNNQLYTSAAVGNANSSSAHTGAGSGSYGGFNNGGVDYLWFSAEVDGSLTDGRHVILPKINPTTHGITRVEIEAFAGTNSNGGEFPDIAGTSDASLAAPSAATYTRSGTTVTVSKHNHGLSVGDFVELNFLSGGAADGNYTIVTVANVDTFTVTTTASGTISGSTNYVKITPLGDIKPDPYYAYIDLLRTENGRQYALNVYDDDTSSGEVTINVATRVKISDTTQSTAGGTGHCPGIGTQVFSVTAASSYSGTNIVSVKNASGTDLTSGRNNLIFRITALGQQGSNPSGNFDDASISANEYICAYNNNVDLLHGGEGWEEGDKVVVTLDQAVTNYNFEIRIEKIESTIVKANIRAVRPEPTPFDAETAVSSDIILGGIRASLGNLGSNDIQYEVIGNGLYIRSSNTFNIQVPDKDLIRVMQSEVDNVAELPNQCKNGYIVKVTNSREADEDDYYLKFVGENGKDGVGSWVECAKPFIKKILNPESMPHVLQRQPDGDFLLKKYTWGARDVGDDTTNPMPTFADGSSKINNVLFHRNRLVFLSGENAILSRPGNLTKPNFFANTALAVSATDPIDISCSSIFPSDLYDGIETTSGLVIFSTNQQFLLAADAEVLNPDTAKLRSISKYSYDKKIAPISLGTTIGYIDNSGASCRFMEMYDIQREGEPKVVETSKVVHGLMPSTIDHVTNSPENNIVLFQDLSSTSNTTQTIYGFKYHFYDERKQAAWFTWEFKTGQKSTDALKYSFIIDDAVYFLDSKNFLIRSQLVQDTDSEDPKWESSTKDYGGTVNDYSIYLDNWVSISGGVYNATTNKTTFTHGTGSCIFNWSTHIHMESSDPTTGLNNKGLYIMYYNDTNSVNIQKVQDLNKGTSFTTVGDLSGEDCYIGFSYDVSLDLPKVYYTQQQGQSLKVDREDYLVLHRIKLHTTSYGSVTVVRSNDRDGDTRTIENAGSRREGNYLASQLVATGNETITVPVYAKNDNARFTVEQRSSPTTSNDIGPFNLQSLTWEGDYNPKNYRRV